MAAKKQLSVEEMLAAARAEKASPAAGAAAAEKSEGQPATAKAAAKPAAAKAAGTMSVAEMLAAARAEKAPSAAASADAGKTAGQSAAKAPAAKAAAPKSRAAAPAAAAAPPADTSSILAAARGVAKRGPLSKAEAEKLAKPVAATKSKTAPPMPEKPVYAQPRPPRAAQEAETRRGFISILLGSFLAVGFTSMAVTSGLWGLGLARFLFPNILTEPPSRFKVGFPSDFPPEAVATKFIPEFGVWVVNTEYDGLQQIVALQAICTHLGCTPNWLDGEQKFKCPCHGSGFYKDGINFEGPAPRPLERYAIRIADDGQLEIDKSRTFQQELGQWKDPGSYVLA